MAKGLNEKDLTKLLQKVVTTQSKFFAKRCLKGQVYEPKHLYNYLIKELDFQQIILIMESESETMYVPILRSLVSANVSKYGELYPSKLKTPKGIIKLTNEDVEKLVRSLIPQFEENMYFQSKGGFLDLTANLNSYFQNNKRVIDVVEKNSKNLTEIVNEEFSNFCRKMSTQSILPIVTNYKLSTKHHQNIMTNIKNYSKYIETQETYLVTKGLENIQQTDGIDIVRICLTFPTANGFQQEGLPLVEIYPTAVIYSYKNKVQLVNATDPVKVKELMRDIIEDAKVLKVTTEEARELWQILANVCQNGVINMYR